MNYRNPGRCDWLWRNLLAVCLTISASAQTTSSPQAATVVQIKVDTAHTREAISPYIYGQFIEHLGRCIYGGIWAEMLEDRKFYFPVPAQKDIWRETREHARVLAASPWKVIGPTNSVSMQTQDAFVGGHSPVLDASGTTVGIYQEELGLMKGRGYTGYIYLAGDSATAPVTVSLA